VVQRRILAQLDTETWTPLTELAGGGLRPSRLDRSRFESVRRAVAKLAAAGLVETKRIYGEVPEWGAWGWPAQRFLLHVRRKP
jgi:hypothetical protein